MELRVPLRAIDCPLRLLRSLERFASARLSNELREASVSTNELWRAVSELLTELAVAEFELLDPIRSAIWVVTCDRELLSVAELESRVVEVLCLLSREVESLFN